MKQHITNEQFYDLSEEKRDVLEKWLIDRGYKNEKLTIGLMIEFLESDFFELGRFSADEFQVTMMDMTKQYVKRELCDALWEAVKELLK